MKIKFNQLTIGGTSCDCCGDPHAEVVVCIECKLTRDCILDSRGHNPIWTIQLCEDCLVEAKLALDLEKSKRAA